MMWKQNRFVIPALSLLSFILWQMSEGSSASAVEEPVPQRSAAEFSSKRPVPSADEIKKAESAIRQLFSAEYERAKSPLSNARLAKSLLNTALDTKDDPAGAFVLLSEARRLAADGGDVATAIAAIASLDGNYQIDALAQRASVLKRMDTTEFPSTTAREAADAILPVVDDATANNSFSIAKSTIAVGLSLASRLRDGPLTSELRRLESETVKLEQQFDAFQAAELTLKTSPMDKEAHRVAARYLALRKRDWIPAAWHASFTDDGPLREVFSHQSAEEATPQAKLALADEWWDLGDGLDAIHKTQARAIAAESYREVIDGLSGLTRRRVEDRLASLPSVLPRSGAFGVANAAAVSPLYLSDLKETSVEYRNDKPNFGFGKNGVFWDDYGEKQPVMRSIVLAGAKSPHGIFVVPRSNGRSSIRYEIGTLHRSTFAATVGVCDQRQYDPLTPVTFEVWGDGHLLWSSRPIAKWGKPESCQVDIRGITNLDLRVECPGDSAFAMTVWSEPRLVNSVPIGQQTVFLSTLKEKSVEYWQYVPKFGFSKDGNILSADPSNPKRDILLPIALGGIESPHALWLHPKPKGRSNIKYDIGSLSPQRFEATVGVCDIRKYGPHTPLTFIVIGDGKTLWTSKPVTKWGQPQTCDIPISGVTVLELRCECPGDAAFANAVWCEPRLITETDRNAVRRESNAPSARVPKYAISNGGLSIWTDPHPLVPARPYRLYVEVREGERPNGKVGQYSPDEDLSVEIAGSDKYVRRLVFKNSQPVIGKDGSVRVWILNHRPRM